MLKGSCSKAHAQRHGLKVELAINKTTAREFLGLILRVTTFLQNLVRMFLKVWTAVNFSDSNYYITEKKFSSAHVPTTML